MSNDLPRQLSKVFLSSSFTESPFKDEKLLTDHTSAMVIVTGVSNDRYKHGGKAERSIQLTNSVTLGLQVGRKIQ